MKLTILRVCGLGSVAASLALFGCSLAPNEPIAGNRQAIEIDPGDTENWAHLTLAMPTGTCLPGNTCGRPLGTTPSLVLDGSPVDVGADVRLKPGDHQLTANNASVKITLDPGANKTFTLPVARSKCTPVALPTVVPTDFGKTPTPTNAPCPTSAVGTTAPAAPDVSLTNLYTYYSTNCSYAFGDFTSSCYSSYSTYTIYSVTLSGGSCINLTSPVNAYTACLNSRSGDFSWLHLPPPSSSLMSSDQVLLPDTYTVNVASGTTKTFTLKEGDLSEVAISLPVVGTVPALFNTTITFADPRNLPTVDPPTITSSCGGDRSYSVPDNATGTLNLKAYTDSSCVYTLTAGGVTRTINQAMTTAFKLYRVDVNDIKVTREDGSTYMTSGTYELYQGGSRVVGPNRTHTGVDAFAGTYEIVISYSTADGPKTQRQTFTL